MDEGIAFGVHLRKVRKEKGMTMEELALEAGVELSTIYRIEKAKMILTLDLLFTIAKALKVPPKELLDF